MEINKTVLTSIENVIGFDCTVALILEYPNIFLNAEAISPIDGTTMTYRKGFSFLGLDRYSNKIESFIFDLYVPSVKQAFMDYIQKSHDSSN